MNPWYRGVWAGFAAVSGVLAAIDENWLLAAFLAALTVSIVLAGVWESRRSRPTASTTDDEQPDLHE